MEEQKMIDNSGCKFIWSMNCVYSENSLVYPHSHPYFHYFYVKGGGGSIEIGENTYPLIPEHIYMMPKNARHSIRSGENGLNAFEIKFDAVEGTILDRIEVLPDTLDLTGYSVEDVFAGIFTEMQNMYPYYEEVVARRLDELVFTLLRAHENSNAQKSTTYSQKFSEVLFYMSQNLEHPITLKELADVAHIEKIYFLKSFKAEIGATPMDYLRTLRINKAKKLLVNSDMNITQISNAVGFQTIHHFTAVFKKTVGKTPTEYKSEKKKRAIYN